MTEKQPIEISHGLRCNLQLYLFKLIPNKFAEFLGISEDHLNDLINGTKLPNFLLAYKISDFLNIDIKKIWINTPKNENNLYTDESISLLNLSVRTENLLKRAHIDSIAKLQNANLKKIRGIGPKAIKEIEMKLSKICTP